MRVCKYIEFRIYQKKYTPKKAPQKQTSLKWQDFSVAILILQRYLTGFPMLTLSINKLRGLKEESSVGADIPLLKVDS